MVGRRARHFSLSFSQDERAPFVASFTCSLSFRWPAITSGQISVYTTKTSPLPHTGHEICHRWSWPISILWLPRRTWAQSDTPNSTRSPDRETFIRKKLSEDMQLSSRVQREVNKGSRYIVLPGIVKAAYYVSKDPQHFCPQTHPSMQSQQRVPTYQLPLI